MLRAFAIVPAAFLLASCSTSGSPKQSRPQSSPEYRTAAASIMGKDVNSTVPVNPENPSPRIRLLPSPGKAPMIGDRSIEVLESNSKSGAYIAFTGQVPPTKYFHVLGRADCDEWIYYQLINPKMVQTNPQYYISREYSEDKAALQCVGKFHEKYQNKEDARLAGADGVIFDANTAVFPDLNSWTIGHRKLHMEGWAIRFEDPTPEEIASRLAKVPTTSVDVVQMKAAAYWIEKNQASQFAPALRKLLPLAPAKSALNSWNGADHSILKALAMVEPASADDAPYTEILEAGMVKMLTSHSTVTVPGVKVQDAPFVAANILACRNKPGTAEKMERVLKTATILQHKLAAAKALIAMGKTDLVQQLVNSGSLGDVTNRVTEMLAGRDLYRFVCPYRSVPSEVS